MATRTAHVAIVDDEAGTRDAMREYCARYARDNAVAIDADVFDDGAALLERYRRGRYDVLFLDVEMPGVDGLDAARDIRRLDADVAIIFVTNMAQYAINGYEVAALDYVIKPLSYYDFSLKLAKALRSARGRSGHVMAIETSDGMRTVALDDIRYVEVYDHVLVFHTVDADYRVRGSMAARTQELGPYGFVRIHKSYLVNLRHVTGMTAATVLCDDAPLPIGRAYKSGLMRTYLAFLDGEEVGG